jgi:hypothetical protein
VNWNDALPAAVIGAAVATAGVFVVELWLKPSYTRKRVARVLLIEMRLNMRLLGAAIEDREGHPERVSQSVFVATRGCDSVGSELHYLSEDALRTVFLSYAQFQEINQFVRAYSQKIDLLLQLDGGAATAVFGETLSDARRFGDMLQRTLDQCRRTVPYLQRLVLDGPPEPLEVSA